MTGNQATLVFSIAGMTCPSCARHVREALEGVDGVGRARVDLRAGRATVEYDRGRATAERMVRAVEEAGYGAASAEGSRAPAQGCGCAGCA